MPGGCACPSLSAAARGLELLPWRWHFLPSRREIGDPVLSLYPFSLPTREVNREPAAPGIHADRALSGDRHHRHPDRPARAGRAESAGGGGPYPGGEQRQADAVGL